MRAHVFSAHILLKIQPKSNTFLDLGDLDQYKTSYIQWVTSPPDSLGREFLMKNSRADLMATRLTIKRPQTSKPYCGPADEIVLKIRALPTRGPVPQLLLVVRPAQLSRFCPLRPL